MNNSSAPSDTGGRFSLRPSVNGPSAMKETSFKRIRLLLADMDQRLSWAAEIVSEGADAFFAEDNWRSREALKSIFVDLNTAADNLPDDVRKLHPEIPWRNLRDIRNILAHNYQSTRHDVLWETAKNHLGPLRSQLIAMAAQHGAKSADEELTGDTFPSRHREENR